MDYKKVDEIAECYKLVKSLEAGKEISLEDAVYLMYDFSERQEDPNTPPKMRELRSSVIKLLLNMINSIHQQEKMLMN